MKIISLNTWGGVVLEPLLNFFEKNKDIDIFCLQEIYKDAEGKEDPHPEFDMKLDLFEEIEKVLEKTHIGYFRPAWKDYYGLATFVKKDFLIKEEGDIVVYENLQPKARGLHSRNLQYIKFTKDSKDFVVANAHCLWAGKGVGKIDTPDRIEQSKRIKDFIGRQDCETVLIGDFNLHPDTKSLAIIAKDMKNLVKDYGIKSTRTSFYKKEKKFADYAFLSSDVEVVDFKVLPDEVSDHAPLYLEIK